MEKTDEINTQTTDIKTTSTINESATQSANKKTDSTTKEPQIFTIESLKEEFKIQDSIFAAIKVSNSWAEGKQVSKDDFKTAVDGWLKAPISKRKDVK